ncbi:10407_t:CDS:2, partial [Funneliformis geosporum]
MNMIDFVKRPGLGRKGRVINVRANYIEISYLPYTNIYHYDVIITPEVPPSLNRRIYCELESLQADVFERSKPVFDGRRNIFTAIPLPFEAATFDITLSIDITPLGERPPCSFNIKVRKVAVINMEILHRFLEGKCSSSSMNILPGIMALNVLIHYKPSIMHVTHNDDEIIYAKYKRSFYTNQISQPLYGGAEVWQRYYQSIKPTSKKLMVNIEVSGTAFYENCSLIQMVVKLLVKRHPDDLRRGIPDRDRVKLERALKNIKIRVTHLGSASKRLFKIVKLTNTPASGTKLEIDGKCTDVASYFQVTYKKPLLYPFLPCVIVRKDTSIPLEGQRHFRKLNERQTADMFKLICPQPQVRANKILQGSEILNHQDNERLRRFGMHISDEMAVV